jgi:uncharacterized protein YprB with RNaseH-like and TPR domain
VKLEERLGMLRSPEARPTLDQLRQRMAAILGRPLDAPPLPRVEREPADPGRTLLPFVFTETEHGPLYRRAEHVGRSRRVGRVGLDESLCARTEILALLALDPALESVDLARALFLDTETTGLGTGAGVLAFLVGLGWFEDDGGFVMEQLLLRQPGEERAMLELLHERFERASVIVTFNGKTFDLPVLATRNVMNHRSAFPARPHLDLLHVARRLHKKRLSACNLGSLESFVLGYERCPDIAGAEVAARYAHFLRTGDEEALRAVIDHNEMDVLSMVALVGLYGEPIERLHDDDLAWLAETFRRAKALDYASEVADRAVTRTGGAVDARRIASRVARARGDRHRALRELEAIAEDIDDPGVRLELVKLYEHHVKEPLKALAVLDQGTGESEEAEGRRRLRLHKKLTKQQRKAP